VCQRRLCKSCRIEPGSPSGGPDRIMACNGVSLAAAVTLWGREPVDLGIVRDEVDAIAAAIDSASGADLLVTSGGASVGDHDLVQASLHTRGFAVDFWKIAMRHSYSWPGEWIQAGAGQRLPDSSLCFDRALLWAQSEGSANCNREKASAGRGYCSRIREVCRRHIADSNEGQSPNTHRVMRPSL